MCIRDSTHTEYVFVYCLIKIKVFLFLFFNLLCVLIIVSNPPGYREETKTVVGTNSLNIELNCEVLQSAKPDKDY